MIARMVTLMLQWARKHPCLLLALCACAGIILAEQGAHTWAYSIAALVLLLLSGLHPRAYWLLPGVAAAFAALHSARLVETFDHPLRAALLEQPGARARATVRGSLLPDAESRSFGRVNAIGTVTEVLLDNGTRINQPTQIQISLPGGTAFPGAGVFELRGELQVPRAATNPGAFDAQRHALRRGFTARLDAERVTRTGDGGEPLRCALLSAAQRSRDWMSDRLTRGISADATTSGVIRAMALGVAEEAQEEVEEAFRDSGTLHVFAVSGLHVGLLGLLMRQLLKMVRLRRSLALPAVILAVIAYAFITGWRPSAARSAWMVALMLLATGADRKASLQNTLGLAACALFLADTQQLFFAGFQLSFGVLWGISMWADSILKPMRAWAELDPFLPARYASRWALWWRGLRRHLASSVAVSVAAWIGSTPFIWYHFQSITPVAVLANIVLVPLSVISLGITCQAVIFAFFSSGGGALIIANHANWLIARLMVISATWFSSLPGANLHVQSVSRPAGEASWRVLDIPNCGAANLLRVGDTHWLFDTGPESTFRTDLKPALRHDGVNSLAGIVLSHNDAGHIGAASLVAADFGRPPLFYSQADHEARDPSHTTLTRMKQSANASLLRALRVGEVLALGPQAKAEVLHPALGRRVGRGDDRAMVLRVEVQGWRVLWVSDAGWLTEQELCDAGADLRCDVLIQNHCESGDSCSTRFLQRASPRLIIHSSVPYRLEQRFPAALADWCAKAQVPCLDTSITGAITLEFHPDSLHAQPLQRIRPITLPRLESAPD